MRYGEVVLRIKRTLDGVEIDTIISISEVEVRKALAMERQRRADRRKRELAASRFQAECDHLDVARLPEGEPVERRRRRRVKRSDTHQCRRAWR